MQIHDIMEDVSSDTSYRRLAQRTLRMLLDHVHTHGTEKAIPISSGDKKGVFFHIQTIDSSLYDLAPLKICFIPYFKQDDTDTTHVAAFAVTKEMIFVFLDPFDNMGIEGYQHWHDAFIHEFIHFLDHRRAPGMFNGEHDNYTDYINSPVELNAFYHQALSMFEEFYEKNRTRSNFQTLVRLLFPTPQKFTDFVIGRLPSEVSNSVSEANLKRIKKRLAQYYQDNKDMFTSG